METETLGERRFKEPGPTEPRPMLLKGYCSDLGTGQLISRRISAGEMEPYFQCNEEKEKGIKAKFACAI